MNCGETDTDATGIAFADPDKKTDIKYDYEVQAWCELIDGEWFIQECAHPYDMKCNCTGRVYKGYRLDDVPKVIDR